MHLFATADLRKRFHIRPEECEVIDLPDPVHAWYGHVQQVSRTKLVLLVHATTRYSVVLEAKGILSAEALHERWSRALPRVAELGGVTTRSLEPLLEHRPLRIAKAVDRRVLGTITEWFRMIRGAAAEGFSLEPIQLSHRLNETPIIGGDVGFPSQRFASLVAS